MKTLMTLFALFAVHSAYAQDIAVKDLPPNVRSLLQSQRSDSGQAACDLDGVAEIAARVDGIGGATLYVVPCQLGADVEDFRVFALNPGGRVIEQLGFVTYNGHGLAGTESRLNVTYDAGRKVLSSFSSGGCAGEAAEYRIELVNGQLSATALRIQAKTSCGPQNPWPTVYQAR